VTRLKEIGQWMGRNGEAIYGAGAGPVRQDQLRSTQKDRAIYLFLLDWPPALSLALKDRVESAVLLSDPSRPGLNFRQTGAELKIELPTNRPESGVSVIALAPGV